MGVRAPHVITGIRLSEHRTAVGYIGKAADGSVIYLEQVLTRSRRRLVTRSIRKYPPRPRRKAFAPASILMPGGGHGTSSPSPKSRRPR
jgi:hypothetical protein